MARKLKEKQKIWARHYVVHWNATKAARDAGYAESGAQARGYENSHNALVLAYVAELVDKINKRCDVDADYVRRRLVEIDQRDLLDIMDDEGNILPVRQWPKVWRQSINSIELGALMRAKDNSEKLIRCVEKLKMPDTLKNLELLGRHVDVKAWDKDAGPSIEVNNIMPVPTAASVDDWEKAAQEQQGEALSSV